MTLASDADDLSLIPGSVLEMYVDDYNFCLTFDIPNQSYLG